LYYDTNASQHRQCTVAWETAEKRLSLPEFGVSPILGPGPWIPLEFFLGKIRGMTAKGGFSGLVEDKSFSGFFAVRAAALLIL